MPIFRYYNPYRRPNFYSYYRPTYNTNPTPVSPPNSPVNLSETNISNSQTAKQLPEEKNTLKQDRSKHEANDNVWLDILGIKLYFDDVLILSLLFFLYKEEVKDEGLFLALVLLLIS